MHPLSQATEGVMYKIVMSYLSSHCSDVALGVINILENISLERHHQELPNKYMTNQTQQTQYNHRL